jgi:hypothetical protein
VVKLLAKENFKWQTMCDEFDKIWPKTVSNKNTKLMIYIERN